MTDLIYLLNQYENQEEDNERYQSRDVEDYDPLWDLVFLLSQED